MTLKEKLDLLWKYLLLAVLIYGFAQIGRPHGFRMMNHHSNMGNEHGMMWFGDDENCDYKDMTVDVEIEKLDDGDSTIKVIVNGETIDLKDFDMKGENVFIKKMKGSGKEKRIKIIKKEMKDHD